MTELPPHQWTFSKSETATLLKTSLSTLDRLIKAGRIRVLYLGPRTPTIPRRELIKFLTQSASNVDIEGHEESADYGPNIQNNSFTQILEDTHGDE